MSVSPAGGPLDGWEPVDWELQALAAAALDLAEAFRDLVPMVVAAGALFDARVPREVADSSAAGRRLPLEARDRLAALADEAPGVLDALLPELSSRIDAAEPIDKATAIVDPFSILRDVGGLQVLATGSAAVFAGHSVGSIDEIAYLRTYLDALVPTARSEMLLRAMFLAVMGSIEPMLLRIVRRLLLHQRPQEFASLGDPDLAKVADRLCREGPAQWRKRLVTKFGLTALNESIDWDVLQRLWEDRNAWMHRGGLVNDRHQAVSQLEVGTVLAATENRLLEAVDHVALARVALASAATEQLSSAQALQVLEGWRAFAFADAYRADRWRLAEGLARIRHAHALTSEARAQSQVEIWMVRSAQGDGGRVREEVEAWQADALAPVYVLAKLILLDQGDDALQMIPGLLAAGALTGEDLETWTLFDRLRAAGSLQHLLE